MASDLQEFETQRVPRQVRAPQGSWPLCSFANTVQNVCAISFLLGGGFAFNLAKVLGPSCETRELHGFLLSLSVFHLLEFLVTAIWNPSRVSVDSFLLNNGRSYYYAHLSSLAEYGLRRAHLLSVLSTPPLVSWLGLGLVVVGQLVRTLAMITAAQSFNHQVATDERKQQDHELVTNGVYRLSRHPAYWGFFTWSLGTQLYLGNPVCFVVFAWVLWKFFSSRIKSEEQHLIKFFGQAYVRYQSSTPTRIPFIP